MDIPEPADLDWYRVLGVKQEATADEMKRAFRKLALVYHPDKAGGRLDGGSRFRRIREAYDTLCDTHCRYCFDLRYERISAEWDKYEAAQEDNRVKREAERVRKEKLEKKAARERAARERMERQRSLLEEVEKLRAVVQSIERSCKKMRESRDRESRANKPLSPDKMDETPKPHEFTWRHNAINLELLMEQYLEGLRTYMQLHEMLYEEMRNRHKQASEEEAQAEAAEEEEEEAARKKEAQEKAAKAAAEREKAKEKAKMEKEAREKAMRERERLAEQGSQEAGKRAREAQEAAARERLARQAKADKEASEAKAAEEEARRRMTPELEEMFKLFQEFSIRSEKESRKAERKNGARDSDCTHRMWWPRSDGTDDCEFCGTLCTLYTLRCPGCDARACVPCKIEQTRA